MYNTRRNKKWLKRFRTQFSMNKGIQGETIERMLERLREGEGTEGIQDRDLVYNDNEAANVNPLTNIRSDKNELMLEEKIGEYEHKHRKMKVVKDEEKAPDEGGNEQEGDSKAK